MGMFRVLDDGGDDILGEFGDIIEYRPGGVAAAGVFIQGLIDRVDSTSDPAGSGGQGNAFRVGVETLHVFKGSPTDVVPRGIILPARDDIVLYEGKCWKVTAHIDDGMSLWMCAISPTKVPA